MSGKLMGDRYVERCREFGCPPVPWIVAWMDQVDAQTRHLEDATEARFDEVTVR